MQPRFVEAHHRLRENTSSYALMRGPLVYCLEGVDNPHVSRMDVRLNAAEVGAGGALQARKASDLLGGVVALHVPGFTPDADTQAPLYQTARPHQPLLEHEVDLVFIPYYTRANRAPTWMKVWVPFK